MRKRGGFSLVETVVAIFSLVTFFTITALIFEFVTDLIGEARVRTVALELASEKIEVVRNMNYSDIGTIGGIPDGALQQTETVQLGGQDFLVTTTVLFVDDPFDGQAPVDSVPTDYKRAVIDVSWSGAFTSGRPVRLVSDFVPKGLESDMGGGTLVVSVINASGQPVPNATVSIENSSVVPAIDLDVLTDSQGEIELPGSPDCVECYEISASRSGHTTDRTYASSEVANPLQPHGTVILDEVTHITLSIDVVSTLTVNTRGPRSSGYPPFTGVQFQLIGSRIIGFDEFDEPVLAYNQSHTSGGGGQVVISNLAWDTYEVEIPNPSSIDFAGSWPVSPFGLQPGSNATMTMVTESASTNNLLIIARDVSETPVATASVTIEVSGGGYIATDSAGVAVEGDRGQVLFTNLPSDTFLYSINQIGFEEATGSAVVIGDSKVFAILEAL